MKFIVEPGPSRMRYQVVDQETGIIYERGLSYEIALTIAGRMNDEVQG